MTAPSRRTVLRLVGLGAIGASLTGCSGLSTESSVRPGLDRNLGPQPAFQFIPNGPTPGMPPDELVRGFLRAGTASGGNYDVARSFLDAAAAKAWVPDGDAVVYDDGEPLEVTVRGSGASVNVSVVARIETGGAYTPAQPGERERLRVTLAKANDEWRIIGLPVTFGRWVGASMVGALFQAYNVVYLAPNGSGTVPDLRWFPRDHLPTRLANAAIEPVPPYLDAAARTSIPGDVTVGSVATEDGIATVDLSTPTPLDASARPDIWTQFVLALGQLDINEVDVRVDGATLEYAGKAPGPMNTSDIVRPRPTVDVQPVIRQGESVIEVNATRLLMGDSHLVPDGEEARSYGPMSSTWGWLALAPRGVEVAAVSTAQDAVARFRDGSRQDVGVAADQIGRPAFDNRGYLWFGGVGSSGGRTVRLWAADARGPFGNRPVQATPVTGTWLESRLVVSLSLSEEGQRALLVSTDRKGNDPWLSLVGVVRDSAGAPSRLATPIRLMPTLVSVVDACWIDDTSCAVIGRVRSKDQVTPFVVSTGGSFTTLGATPGGVSIRALSSQRNLVVTTDNGWVLGRSGVTWRRLVRADALVVGP